MKISNLKFILDLIFPRRCIGCNKQKTWLCSDCLHIIQKKKTQACYLCGKASFFGETCPKHLNKNPKKLDGLIVCAHYNGNPILKKAIKTMKYQGRSEDIIKQLGTLLGKTVLSFIKHNKNVKSIIPVPLHATRIKERGFNQSELLSIEVLKHSIENKNIPQIMLDITSLTRIKETISQASCKSRKERINNLKNAFKSKKLSNKTTYILIDDVCTTGRTLEECCKTLKTNGAKTVWSLVLGRNR